MKIGNAIWVTLGLLTLGLLASLPAAANNTVDNGTFNTSAQSMWSSGAAFNFSANPTLFNIPLNADTGPVGVGCTSDCTVLGVPVPALGATVDGTISGNFGVSASLNVNGGTVSSAIPISVTEGFPGIPVGSAPVTITSSGMFGTGSLTTASPSIQASASTFGSLSGAITGTACAGACTTGTIASFGPASLATTLFSIDSKTTPPQTISLGPLTLTVGLPFVATNGTAGPQTFPPPLSIASSGGPSNFLGLSADVTDVVTTALGLPPLHGSGSIGPLSGSYNILDVTAGLNLGATQAFNLTATPEVAYKVVEVGSNPQTFNTAAMNVGTPFTFSIAAGDSAAFITPNYLLSADLMNNTGLALSATGTLTALGASLGIGPFNLGFGPLVNLSTSFPIANYNVFNSTFALGGWNEFTGNTFEVIAPEPGTFVLLGMGLLALACGLQRRKNRGLVASI